MENISNKNESNKEKAEKIEMLEKSKESLLSLFRFGKKMLMPTFIATTMLITGKLAQEKATGFESTDIEGSKFNIENTNGIKTNLPEISIYGHSDPETDAILNFLTGKSDFSPEQKLIFYRRWEESVSKFLSNELVEEKALYEQLINMSDDEFVEYYKKNNDGIDPRYDDFIPLYEYEFDITRYNAMWELHRKNSNPTINFFTAEPDVLSSKGEVVRTHYLSSQNKIMIDFNDTFFKETFLDAWIAELSHAKQYQDKPLTSKLKHLIEIVGLLKENSLQIIGKELSVSKNPLQESANMEDMSTLYDKSYKEKNTIEYEAHTILQPQLEASLEKRIEDINKELEELK